MNIKFCFSWCWKGDDLELAHEWNENARDFILAEN